VQEYAGKWLVFLLAEAGADASGRVRVWRALKTLGPAVLRDGVYLLPARPDLERSLAERRADVKRAGGQAYVFTLEASPDDESALRQHFDRSAEFGTLVDGLRRFAGDDVPSLGETEARRALVSLQREYKSLTARDYFPERAQDEATAALSLAEAAFAQRFSPGEPHAEHRDVPRLDRASYQNRVWATRERLWVDRVASAWLIRKFIDPKATFRWLSDVRDCPADALGFDFDGATFTHIGDLVTFEVLLHAFDLATNDALLRLSALVHALDLAGTTYSPEASGFETLLTGAREQSTTDDELVDAVFPVLDLLYAGFARDRNGAPQRVE
jgi:hypothetical protein